MFHPETDFRRDRRNNRIRGPRILFQILKNKIATHTIRRKGDMVGNIKFTEFVDLGGFK
jgi:hypothetical protein